MRVIFKDGSSVEHVAATSAEEVGDQLILKTAEGDVVAELTMVDVERWEAVS